MSNSYLNMCMHTHEHMNTVHMHTWKWNVVWCVLLGWNPRPCAAGKWPNVDLQLDICLNNGLTGAVNVQ